MTTIASDAPNQPPNCPCNNEENSKDNQCQYHVGDEGNESVNHPLHLVPGSRNLNVHSQISRSSSLLIVAKSYRIKLCRKSVDLRVEAKMPYRASVSCLAEPVELTYKKIGPEVYHCQEV